MAAPRQGKQHINPWPPRGLRLFVRCVALFATVSLPAGAADPAVDFFGAIDLSFLHSSTGKGTRRTSIESGAHDGSFIAWRGREPLAPGYSATFNLIYGLAPDSDTGIGSTQFGSPARTFQGSVGLITPLGEFKAGRLPSPVNQVKRFDPMLGNKFSGLTALLPMVVNLGTDPTRFSNAISYASPQIAGWQFSGLYAFAPYVGDTNADGREQERAAAVALAYAGADLSAIIGHQDTRHLGGASVLNSPQVRDTSVALAWNVAPVRLSVIGLRSVRQVGGTERVIDHADVGLLWHLDSHNDLGLQLARLHEHDRPLADAHSVAVHFDHFLSKRTTLYAGYNLTRNDANARYSADQFNRPAPGRPARLSGVGIQHNF